MACATLTCENYSMPALTRLRNVACQSAALTRKLAILRAHRLIRKVPATHRYILTQNGRPIVTALLAARRADVDQLTRVSAKSPGLTFPRENARFSTIAVQREGSGGCWAVLG